METKDRNNTSLQRGGEIVTAELRYKNVNTVRSLNVNIEDLRDGKYKLSFVPDAPGKLMLSICVKGQQIKVQEYSFNLKKIKLILYNSRIVRFW